MTRLVDNASAHALDNEVVPPQLIPTASRSVMGGRASVLPRGPNLRRLWSRHGSRSLSVLTVVVAALIGCASATAAPRAAGPSYLFSIPTASGSLIGPNDRHLTLRMTDARDYLTRFTDHPLRQAFVVANGDFAKRFKRYFEGSDPNAVLTYTPPGAHIPVSIVLTLGQPRWDARHHTWTFPAARIRKQPDNLPGSTVHIRPPLIRNPRSFKQATLFIDGSGLFDGCAMVPGTQCPGLQAQLGDFHDLDLADADFTYTNFTGANLTGANLSDATFHDSTLSGATLSGANLGGADLSDVLLDFDILTGANLTGADLSHAALVGADLHAANLTGADLSHANLAAADLTRANLADADLSYAQGADLSSAELCDTTLPDGGVDNTGCPPG
jgi:hypothetical protein